MKEKYLLNLVFFTYVRLRRDVSNEELRLSYNHAWNRALEFMSVHAITTEIVKEFYEGAKNVGDER